MPACPSCQADVDEEADLCLSCGEPLGDSPAARIARAELSAAAPTGPAPTAQGATAVPEHQLVRSSGPQPSTRATLVDSPAARRRRVEEPEPIRCPGCGVPSKAARCPGCGAVLR